MISRWLNKAKSPPRDFDVRHEIKFVSDPWRVPLVEIWAMCSKAAFRETYPPRRVNNVYFDTIDLDAFSENLSGISSRTKVRFRWYGKTVSPEGGVIEIKQRRNDVGTKAQIRTSGVLELDGRSWRSVAEDLRGRISEKDELWLKNFDRPSIINRYDRKYYESLNGNLRLTIDTNQVVFDQTKAAIPNFDRKSNLPDCAVVEVKFRPEESDYASTILKDLPIRRSRNSKYMVGVNSTFYQY